MNRLHTLAALGAAVAALAACGGSDDDPHPVPPPAATDAVPDSASASSAGLTGYLVALAAMPVEDKEPLSLDSFAPKTFEDTEPDPVD